VYINLLTFRGKRCIYFYTFPTLAPAHYKYILFSDCMWRHCTKPTLVKDYSLHRLCAIYSLCSHIIMTCFRWSLTTMACVKSHNWCIGYDELCAGVTFRSAIDLSFSTWTCCEIVWNQQIEVGFLDIVWTRTRRWYSFHSFNYCSILFQECLRDQSVENRRKKFWNFKKSSWGIRSQHRLLVSWENENPGVKMKAIRVRIPLVCGRLCSVESDNEFSIEISDRICQSAVLVMWMALKLRTF